MTLAEGQQIGTYRIERAIGSGGMGVVYTAIDMRLGRRAAIKQLLPALSSDHDIVERFFNEAKAAASINHPSIVEIYDVGWHADGSAFFAMKLLEGESIGRRLRARGPFAIEIAATVARQVATALGAAHARGIVHRDLKPDNVMLVRDDEVVIGERAIVLDFGIAKLFGENPNASKTRTGQFMGTPAYMSPEQCRGANDVDHRTDVYALGCIVFEMLTGRPPFVAQGGGEIVGMHQYVAPPDVRSVRADVPEPLAQLIAKALAKNPGERFQTMAELALALGPFAVQGVHTLPAGHGVTQLSAPPGVAAAASTYSRGQVSAPPVRSSRVVTFLLGMTTLLALTALGVVVTCRGSSSKTAGVPIDAPLEAGDRVTMLRAATNRAMRSRNWTEAQVAIQKWLDTAPDDTEAQTLARKVNEETSSERAFEDLEAALKEKRHLDGAAAFERIPVGSVYRDRAIEMFAKLRKDWIDKNKIVARELAAKHECKKLQQLQAESNQMGGDSYNAVTVGIQCVEAPPTP